MTTPPMHGMIKIVAFAGLLFLVGFVGIVFMPPGMSGIPWSLGVFALFVIVALIMGIMLPLKSSVLAAALFWLSAVSVDLYATTFGHRFELEEITLISVMLLAVPALRHSGRCLLRLLDKTTRGDHPEDKV